MQLQPLLLRVQLQPEGAIATTTIKGAIATGSAIAAPSRQTQSPRSPDPREVSPQGGGDSPGRWRPRRLSSGCGAAPARLALQSRARRRVRPGSAPSGVRWSGSAGAQQGTLHPGYPISGVAAPPPDRDATLLCEWRVELMRGTKRETLGPNLRP